MDQTIPIGAPAVPLQITIGTTAYTVILHDNGDGTYVLRLQDANGTYTDLAATLAELNLAAGESGDLYTLPAAGIPETDLAAAVQASLGLADTSLQPGALVADLAVKYLQGTVTLNGVNPTPVAIGGDAPAQITGAVDEPFDLSSDKTLIVDPDGAGDDTVTFQATAGTSVSGASPSTDITAETDTKFMISVDGDTAEEVTLDVALKSSGALIATELQTKIRALGGTKANVNVAFTTVYTITSNSKGTASAVVVTDAATGNIADTLKLGTANGGTETAGTGDAANIAAATAAEVAAAITAKATGWTGFAVGTKVGIVSDTDGKDSSLAVNGASTADTVLGITGTDYGAQGLGYTTATMDDTDYAVLLTLNGTAKADIVACSAANRTTSGFDIIAATDASTANVDVLVVGPATIA